MSWTEYFDRIVVINLPHRKDRLIEVTEEMDKYGIEFELVDGIKNDNGAEGLRQTVENIFLESIEAGHRRILIFEDDCQFVHDPTEVMNNAVKELPENWHILYLGAQCTNGFKRRQSSALLQLDMAFATHAWALSLQGMKEIISIGLEAPIDNSIVSSIQPLQQCYITYPLLATQRPGMSSIGNTWIDWNAFIVTRYNQKLAEMG